MIASTLRCFWLICGLFLFSLVLYTCISCLKLCLVVHTSRVSTADRARIVESADGSGDWKALCEIFRSIPKRLTDGSKVVLKSGDSTLVAGARLLRKSRWMPFAE